MDKVRIVWSLSTRNLGDASCVILRVAAIEVHEPKSEIWQFPLIFIYSIVVFLQLSAIVVFLQYYILSILVVMYEFCVGSGSGLVVFGLG